jgi:hypothetical protein
VSDEKKNDLHATTTCYITLATLVCVLVVFVGSEMYVIINNWRFRPDPLRVRFAQSLENNNLSLLLPTYNRKAGVHLCNYINMLCASRLSGVWSTCGVFVVGVHSGIRERTTTASF